MNYQFSIYNNDVVIVTIQGNLRESNRTDLVKMKNELAEIFKNNTKLHDALLSFKDPFSIDPTAYKDLRSIKQSVHMKRVSVGVTGFSEKQKNLLLEKRVFTNCNFYESLRDYLSRQSTYD